MEELVIRKYWESDQDEVIRLWHDCRLVVPWNDPEADIRAKVLFQPDLFLVGLWEGRLAATVMVGYEGHRGWINYLAVAPNLRRREIGRRMMAAAEERLRTLGCPKINLQVRASNAGVIAFYQALGYIVDEVVCLGKRLNQGAGRND
ncbi:MAG: GNAT family acetyltransferase [Thermodesulfobacteriota bacterium]